jgi:two-component system NtrC family sensor kinase
MKKPDTGRSNIFFRLSILVFATLVLFLGIISLNSKLSTAEPESGILAVEGSSFVHLTYTDPALEQALIGLKYLEPERLDEESLQVLMSLVAEKLLPDGSTLAISWSYADMDLPEKVLHYRTSIDNATIREWEEKFQNYDEMFSKIDEAIGINGIIKVTYIPNQKLSGGMTQEANVQILPKSLPLELDFIVKAVSGFLFFIIGFVVFFSTISRRLPFAEQLFVICLFFFIILSFTPVEPASSLQWAAWWLRVISILFAPVLLLHLILLLKEEEFEWLWSTRKLLLYLPASAFLVLNITAVVQHLYFTPASTIGEKEALSGNPLMGIITIAEPIYFLVSIVFILGVLLKSYGETKLLEHKKQFKWLFWGIGFGLFPFAFVSAFLTPVQMDNPVVNLAVSIPLFITPFCFALAFYGRRVHDVEIIFKRGFVYFTTSSTLLGIYIALFFGLRNFAIEVSMEIWALISGAMILLASLISHRIKDQVQSFFDKFLYRDFYNFRKTLQQFSTELSYERDLDRLLEKISDRIKTTFSIPVVITFITSANRENFVLAHSTVDGLNASYISQEDSELFLKKLVRGRPVYIDQMTDIAISEVFREIGAITFIPFMSMGDVIGFIGIGNNESGDLLNSEDLDLLSSFTTRAAAALDNAMLYMDLQNRAVELEELKDFNENIVESVDSGICVVDFNGNIKSWNTAMAGILCYSRDEVMDKYLLDLLPYKLANIVEPYIHSSDATGRFHSLYKVKIVNKKGKEKFLNISFAPFGYNTVRPEDTGRHELGTESSDSRSSGNVIIVDDITDGVKMEEQLGKHEKMASLGLLAAGVAHEVNTPLTGISSYVQMLQRKVESASELKGILDKVEKQAFRASRIINSLLSFSRQGASDRMTLDMNQLVQESLSLVESQMKYPNVRINTELSRELGAIIGDKTKLQQVVINLLLNARDSLKEGGVITIKTGNEEEMVICSISDNGTGIPLEIQPKVFDPFFTTKKIGQGTGLGLSVSYGIIQEHQGEIDLISEPGRGTTFKIKIPMSGEKTETVSM